MAKTKQKQINPNFLFIFLALFPFGQIIRYGIIQPIDVVVGLTAAYILIKHPAPPVSFNHLVSFFAIAAVSWMFSLVIFPLETAVYGVFYLIRLIAYGYFYYYVKKLLDQKSINAVLVINSLFLISLVSAFFGWIQFFVFPDIKPMFIWGWDMHLYRLVGTFFDPAFLGLIIVFGLIISINKVTQKLTPLNILGFLFLFISLAFTYSRASYIAFVFAMVVLAVYKKEWKKFAVVVLVLALVAVLLPTTKNHSIELLRGFSVVARVQNYVTTLQIFGHSPILGVGYNNMCAAYRQFIGFQKFTSHACSGSDSSILFILATTGVTGLFVFIYSMINFYKGLLASKYATYILPILFATLIHSVFSNSMFYPWIMGFVVIISTLL